MGHHHRNAALPSRRSCSTPSGAAAPASADSRPCSEAQPVACEAGRVGTVESKDGSSTASRRRPSFTAIGSCRPDVAAGAHQALCPAGPRKGPVKSLPPRCSKKAVAAAALVPTAPPYYLTMPAPTPTAPGAASSSRPVPGHHRPAWPVAGPDRARLVAPPVGELERLPSTLTIAEDSYLQYPLHLVDALPNSNLEGRSMSACFHQNRQDLIKLYVR